MHRFSGVTAVAVLFGLVLGLTAGPAIEAHHAFAAEFDSTKPVALRGTIIKMEWINPHSWLHLAVKTADGTRLFAGSSGTGAPRDGKDPSEK